MRWIGQRPTLTAVDMQIHLLEDGLPDEHLITQHQTFLTGMPTHDLNQHRLGHIHLFLPSISVFGYLLERTR